MVSQWAGRSNPAPLFPAHSFPPHLSPPLISLSLGGGGGLCRLSKPRMEGQRCRPQVTAPGAHLLPPTSAQPFLCLYVPFGRELELGTGVALSASSHFVDGIRSLPLKCQGNSSLSTQSLSPEFLHDPSLALQPYPRKLSERRWANRGHNTLDQDFMWYCLSPVSMQDSGIEQF